jgi:hypothetical protein
MTCAPIIYSTSDVENSHLIVRNRLRLPVTALRSSGIAPVFRLAPVIRLSTDEATKAKQLAQDVVDAKARSAKGKLAWEQFHQTYQAAHTDLPYLRFSEDFRLAFALLESWLR